MRRLRGAAEAAAAAAWAAWREPVLPAEPAGRTPNALMVIIVAPPLVLHGRHASSCGPQDCAFEAKRYQPRPTSDFLTCVISGDPLRPASPLLRSPRGFGRLGPVTDHLQHVRAELLQLAGADTGNRDQCVVVGGQQLGDRDQGVVGEHDVGGHVQFPRSAQPPIF
jgi:hypothetical protein